MKNRKAEDVETLKRDIILDYADFGSKFMQALAEKVLH
jgi:hypothetical protein